MADAFTITTASGSINLDRNRHGTADFSVTNISGQPVRARALPVADAPAQADWFAIADGAERNFPVGGTEQYVVSVTAPPTAAPGSYRFRLDVLGTDNPDEVQAHGQWVAFQVAAPPKRVPRQIPWRWIIIAAAAVVVLAAIAVTVWVLTHRQGTLSPSVSTVSFGTVAVNGTASMTVAVRNTGAAATAVTATVAGPDANQFHVVDTCGAGKLQPNATCTVQVQFMPTIPGGNVAVLRLNADNAAPVSVPLTGTGAVPIVFAPPFRAFETGAGFQLSTLTGRATVTNAGAVDLHVRSVVIKTNSPVPIFVLTDTCSGQAVPPRQSCSITIDSGAFSPSVVPSGLLTGTLIIVSDASNSPLGVAFSEEFSP